MKERLELIKELEKYQNTFGMGFDSTVAITVLIKSLKDEEDGVDV